MFDMRPGMTGVALKRRETGALALALLACLAGLSSGCITHRRDLGQETTRVIATRVESTSAPALGWPVTILIDGKTAGTWPTNANGDVAVNLKNFLPVVARKGSVRLACQIRTPEGAIETREFVLTPDDFKASPR